MFRCDHHHQGAHCIILLKLHWLKQSAKIHIVMWLNMQPHHQINHTDVF